MSMDAGRPAHMSYKSFPSTIGFLALDLPPEVKVPISNASLSNPLRPLVLRAMCSNSPHKPFSSLAGPRTTPKSATATSFPLSALPAQVQCSNGLESSRFADNKQSGAYNGPKDIYWFDVLCPQTSFNAPRQTYALSEQVLAPSEIQIDDLSHEQMDPNLYAQLVATNMALAAQQQRLQQQLINIQAAAQQFQGLSLGQMG